MGTANPHWFRFFTSLVNYDVEHISVCFSVMCKYSLRNVDSNYLPIFNWVVFFYN